MHLSTRGHSATGLRFINLFDRTIVVMNCIFNSLGVAFFENP